MERRWLIIIGVVVLGVLGFAVYKAKQSDQEIGKPKPPPEYPVIAIPEDIDKISVQDGKKEEVVLEKQGDKWMVTKPVNAPANQQAVKDVVANLKGVKVDRHVDMKLDDATKKEKKLDAEQALHVQAWKGADKKGDLFFGTNNLMVLPSHPDKAWVAKDFSNWLYTKDIKGWRETEIWKFDEANANQITLTNKAGEYSFTKGDKGWGGTFKGKPIEKFEEQKVKDMLLDLKSIHAEDFGDGKPASETELDKPKATVTIQLKDNAGKYSLKLGKDLGPGTHYAQKEGDPTIVVLSKIASDWINAEPTKFQKPAPAADAGAGEGGAPEGGAPKIPVRPPQ